MLSLKAFWHGGGVGIHMGVEGGEERQNEQGKWQILSFKFLFCSNQSFKTFQSVNNRMRYTVMKNSM